MLFVKPALALFIQVFAMLLPWVLRRWLLCALFGYRIHPTSRIGLALIYPERLVMERHSRIGHGTVCRRIGLLHLKAHATIGTGNWVGGCPQDDTTHFADEEERRSALVLGEHAAITTRHIIDATNTIHIGDYSTLAGFQSQLLTHSIDLETCRQVSGPIGIGDYCFVGTNVVILKDAVLPDHSVLGAKSLLHDAHAQSWSLYAGVPARRVKSLEADARYFSRVEGLVR